jgi:hypothetical protein
VHRPQAGHPDVKMVGSEGIRFLEHHRGIYLYMSPLLPVSCLFFSLSSCLFFFLSKCLMILHLVFQLLTVSTNAASDLNLPIQRGSVRDRKLLRFE